MGKLAYLENYVNIILSQFHMLIFFIRIMLVIINGKFNQQMLNIPDALRNLDFRYFIILIPYINDNHISNKKYAIKIPIQSWLAYVVRFSLDSNCQLKLKCLIAQLKLDIEWGIMISDIKLLSTFLCRDFKQNVLESHAQC